MSVHKHEVRLEICCLMVLLAPESANFVKQFEQNNTGEENFFVVLQVDFISRHFPRGDGRYGISRHERGLDQGYPSCPRPLREATETRTADPRSAARDAATDSALHR